MQYMIMILIVLGLAAADYVTGLIKAYCTKGIESQKMRKGGLNKLCELIIMVTACGLDIGIHVLGQYYDVAEFGDIAGTVSAVMVFMYITVMEVVSIFENYAVLNPEAKWAQWIIRRLKNVHNETNKED
ncbi:MAG: phage holin family protein [Oscillospiraceae bacterium]|nr:phage holin family protein [Oscillospiraceae bacterium]